MPTIRSRSAANLPAVPSSISHRSLSSWAGIRVHHTGGSFSSWRSIHDWQTAGRPPGDRLAYIGYSFGISSGDVWTLRGFDHHPAHDFINSHIGVVFGGNFETRLPRDEDLEALVWFVAEAEQRCQKRLPISTHREVGQTTCPGGRLHQWIKQELPGRLAGEESDMELSDRVDLWDEKGNKPWRAGKSIGVSKDKQSVSVAQLLQWGGEVGHLTHNRVLPSLTRIEAQLKVLAGQDAGTAVRQEFAKLTDSLVAAVRDAVPEANQDTVEAALRQVLGTLDEPA